MAFAASRAGLTLDPPSPASPAGIDTVVTEEAAVLPPWGPPLHVTPLVAEGDVVARGMAVACLRHAPDVCLVAPMSGRVARLSLLPGRTLSEIVLFREPGGSPARHDPLQARSPEGLRRLMQVAGVWPHLRRRPFGGMPGHDEMPAAIVVMAVDTRPLAPDPCTAVDGLEDCFLRGVRALSRLTEGPVFVCLAADAPDLLRGTEGARIRAVAVGPRHPQGSAGICIHRLHPAGPDAPVWDIHAEDVAALGALLGTGELPMERIVHVAGAGLREARTVRTHPGADLRQLTQRLVRPGPHSLISGSPLGGNVSRWLEPRHRQVTVLPRAGDPPHRHWLASALRPSGGNRPAIPSAALSQSFAGALPAAPFVRALAAGDDETAIRLGLLSLLEEDVALADYVLGAAGSVTACLRVMLDRARAEFGA